MEKEMKEIWKPVKGFEDYAEVSNYGQIHKFERVIYFGTNHQSKRIQKEEWTYGYVSGMGYLYASIGSKKFRVNRLVYMTFVGDIPDGMEVNHLDENKHNNRLDNLNLLSHDDNIRYGTGIARNAAAHRGKKHSEEARKKMSVAQKNNSKKSKAVQALDPATMEVVMEFPSTKEAQRQGYVSGSISRCCRGKQKFHKGYIWRYAS